MKLETIYTNRDDGLSGIFKLIIHFIFQFSTNFQIQNFIDPPIPLFLYI